METSTPPVRSSPRQNTGTCFPATVISTCSDAGLHFYDSHAAALFRQRVLDFLAAC
jgi:hypothetical protein